MNELDNLKKIICSYYGINRDIGKDFSLEKLNKAKKDNQKRTSLIKRMEQELERYKVVDWTDMDKSVCYEFKILLHKDQPLLDDDVELIKELGGKRRDLRLFISLLTNYYYIFVEESSYSEELAEWKFYYIYNDDLDTIMVKQSIKKILSDMNYIELGYSLANTILPDIETEFIEKGEVKVFNCLFTDLVTI